METEGNQVQQNKRLNMEEFEKMISFIIKKFKDISLSDASELVVLLGATGSGKTTVSCVLENMMPLKTFINEEPNNVNGVGPRVISDPNKQIGLTSNSQTIFQNFRKFYGQNLLVCDTPGSGDSAGITQRLINSYILKMIFSLKRKVKVVLVVSEGATSQTAQKQKILKSSLRYVSDLLKNDGKNNVGLLVTNVPNQGITFDQIFNRIKMLQQNSTNDLDINDNVKDLLKNIINEQRIQIMNSPPNNRNLDDVRDFYWNEKKFPEKFLRLLGRTQDASYQEIQITLDQQSKDIIMETLYNDRDILKKLQQRLYGILQNSLSQLTETKIDCTTLKSYYKKCRSLDSLINHIESKFRGQFQALSVLRNLQQMVHQLQIPHAQQIHPILTQLIKIIKKLEFFKNLNFSSQQRQKLDPIRNFRQCFSDRYMNNPLLSQKVDELKSHIKEQIKKVINSQMDSNLLEIELSEAYSLWKNCCMFMPSLFHLINNPKNTPAKQYFKNMKQKQQKLSINVQQVSRVTNLLQNSEELFSTNTFNEFQVNIEDKMQQWIIGHLKALVLDISGRVNWQDRFRDYQKIMNQNSNLQNQAVAAELYQQLNQQFQKEKKNQQQALIDITQQHLNATMNLETNKKTIKKLQNQLKTAQEKYSQLLKQNMQMKNLLKQKQEKKVKNQNPQDSKVYNAYTLPPYYDTQFPKKIQQNSSANLLEQQNKQNKPQKNVGNDSKSITWQDLLKSYLKQQNLSQDDKIQQINNVLREIDVKVSIQKSCCESCSIM